MTRAPASDIAADSLSELEAPPRTSTQIPTSGAQGARVAGAPAVPTCSVIVPVYQHWHGVPELLRRLEEQTVPERDFEVLRVDNGCPDYTPPADVADNVRILHCGAPASYAARNHGVEHARGEWLVFTDADCLPRRDWLEALLNRAQQANGAPRVLAGQVVMVGLSEEPSPWEVYDFVKGIPQARYVTKGYATTANLAVPAQVVQHLRRFDATRYSGADADFCRRAGANGTPIEYVAGAEVEHPVRDSWNALATKTRRIKGGQLTAGSRRQRAQWWLRTFTPPVLAFGRFLTTRRAPLRYRLLAVGVQIGLWGVEMAEAMRLLVSGEPERR